MENQIIDKIIQTAAGKQISSEAVVGRIMRKFLETQGYAGATVKSGFERARNRAYVKVYLRKIDYSYNNCNSIRAFISDFIYTPAELQKIYDDNVLPHKPKVDVCEIECLGGY